MSMLVRLKEYLDYKGVSVKKFEQDAGISSGALARAMRDGSSLSHKSIDKILNVSGELSTEWLMRGEGEMIRKTEPEVEILHKPKIKENILEHQSIKLYELDAAANLNTLNLEASREFAENIQVPNAPKCDGATYVKGDSMYPLLKSGDIVAFKQVHNIDYILYGEMYLVSYNIDGDDYLVVKFVCKSEKEGHVKLVSQNEHHAPRDIPVSSIRYLGIVKISIRLNSSI